MKKKYLLILFILALSLFPLKNDLVFTDDLNVMLTNDSPFQVVHMVDSPLYMATELDSYSNYSVAQRFSKDIPIFWKDISAFITPKNKALGYIDVVISVTISNYPGDTQINKWSLYGDWDVRNDYDYRAWCDGSIYEMIDENHKDFFTYNDDDARYISYGAESGQFSIMRFEVPKDFSGPYKLFLGKAFVPEPYYDSTGRSYQVKLYTPVLKGNVFPVVKIVSPEVDFQYTERYSDESHGQLNPSKTRVLAPNVAYKFSAADTLNTSGKEIIDYSWDMGDGTTLNGKEVDHMYKIIGSYSVILSVTTADGTVYKNNSETTIIKDSYDPASSSPLPFSFSVLNPPTDETLDVARPSPFVIGKDAYTTIDFKISKDTHVELMIFTLKNELVKTLKNENMRPGFWSARWDGKNDNGEYVGDSFYFYVLKTDHGQYVNKIRVVR